MSDIQNLFRTATPEPPATGEWAGKVRDRRRRRRTVTGVAAAVLAVGLAVPLGTTLLNRPAQVAAPPTPPLTSTAVDGRCAEAATIVEERVAVDPADAAPLKEGATKAWLCGDEYTAGPLDALTVGVDEAYAAFTGAEIAPIETMICTMEYRLAYTVVFEYADGSIHPVTGELHGCKTMSDGNTYRVGGDAWLDTLEGLWTVQREATDVSIEALPDCRVGATVIPADLSRVFGTQTCFTTNGEVGTTTRVQDFGDGLSTNAEIAAAFAASLEADSTTVLPDMMEFPEPGVVLQLVDRYGAALSLTQLTDGSFLYYVGDEGRVWTPPAELAEVVSAATTES